MYTQALIYHTSKEWLDYLQNSPSTQLVNFWTGGRSRLMLDPGAPFFFKRAGSGAIVGYGYFLRKHVLTIEQAWQKYGTANGAPTLEAKIRRAREVLGVRDAGPGTEIGCIELGNPRFLSESSWIFPRDLGISEAITAKKIDRFTAEEIIRRMDPKANA